MLARVKISTIVTVSTLALAGIIGAGAWMAASGSSSMSADLKYINENSLPSVDLLEQTVVDFQKSRIRLARAFNVQDSGERASALKDFDKAVAKVDTDVTAYAKLLSDQRDTDLYNTYKSKWTAFRDRNLRVRSAVMSGDLAHAEAMFDGPDMVNDARELQSAIEADKDYNLLLAKNNTDSSVAKAQDAFWRNAVLGVSGMLVGLLVLWLFRSRVTRPVDRLKAAMNIMAAGQTDIEIPGADKGDELGEIARALDGIRVSIAARSRHEAEQQIAVQQQVTTALEAALSAMKEGRLGYRITQVFPREYEQLRSDFNTTIDALSGQMGEVARSSGAVRTGANEISAAAQDLARRTEGQAASLGETSNTVKELTNSVSESRSAATNAAHAAQEAEKEATNSGMLMHEAVAAMNSIAETSSKMRSIVEIIDGISFQTNLLALNAGVEAARAGDAGKGFAVVATEVRNLAERSAEAAKEISSLIVHSGAEVSHGVQMVSQTQASLQRIVQKAGDLAGMISGIADGANRQADAIAQVNAVISELDKATQQNAALVEESTAASHSLANESERLSAVVGRFSMGGEAPSQRPAPVAATASPVFEMPRMRSAPRRPAPSAQGNAAVAEDWSEF